MNVFTYWEGPKPEWISLCMESLERNVPSLKLLDKESWVDVCQPHAQLKSRVNAQAPNVKSDFIRASCLFHLGGVWVDADCICFDDLSQVMNYANQDGIDFVAYRAQKMMCSALIASHPGRDTARHYLTIMEQKLLGKGSPRILARNALGPTVLARATRLAGQRTYMIPQQLVHPHAHWLAKRKLWRKQQMEIDPDAMCFMLTHRALGPWANHPRHRLLSMENVVGRAFRRAFRA